MKPKFPEIVERIEKQLLMGDHRLTPMQGSEALAKQMGVSYMTARRAVQELVSKGLLVRQPNGRVAVNHERIAASVPLQLAFLAPAFTSPAIEQLRHAAERVASDVGVGVRPVEYVHWGDPVVRDTIDRFDGVFLVQSSEPIPAYVQEYLNSVTTPVVLAEKSNEDIDLPYFDFLPHTAVDQLMDHLVGLGHRSFLLVNTHPKTAVVLSRVARWRRYLDQHGLAGEFLDRPVKPYTHPTPHAHRVISKLPPSGAGSATAVVCVSLATAVGAIRAFEDRGARVGGDVAVCAVDGESLARYHCPSITSMEKTDIEESIQKCLRWFSKRGSWEGPRRLSSEPTLFIGESTAGRRPPAADPPPGDGSPVRPSLS